MALATLADGIPDVGRWADGQMARRGQMATESEARVRSIDTWADGARVKADGQMASPQRQERRSAMSKIVLSADAFLALASEVDSQRLSGGRWSWQDHEEYKRLMETPPGRSRRSTRDVISRRSSRKARNAKTDYAHAGPASDVRAVYAEPTYPGWRTKASPVQTRHRPF